MACSFSRYARGSSELPFFQKRISSLLLSLGPPTRCHVMLQREPLNAARCAISFYGNYYSILRISKIGEASRVYRRNEKHNHEHASHHLRIATLIGTGSAC